jgi:hypothetical protein
MTFIYPPSQEIHQQMQETLNVPMNDLQLSETAMILQMEQWLNEHSKIRVHFDLHED